MNKNDITDNHEYRCAFRNMLDLLDMPWNIDFLTGWFRIPTNDAKHTFTK